MTGSGHGPGLGQAHAGTSGQTGDCDGTGLGGGDGVAIGGTPCPGIEPVCTTPLAVDRVELVSSRRVFCFGEKVLANVYLTGSCCDEPDDYDGPMVFAGVELDGSLGLHIGEQVTIPLTPHCSGSLTGTLGPADNYEVVDCGIEIQVNPPTGPGLEDTQTNDLVRLKSIQPHKAYPQNTRARLTTEAALGSDVSARLIHGSQRVRLAHTSSTNPGHFSHSIEVTLPANGGWVDFYVMGHAASQAVDDAAVVAYFEDEEVGREDLTVFWFSDARLDFAVTGSYGPVVQDTVMSLENNQPPTITHTVSAKVRPEGVPCNEEEITRLRVAMVQNANAGTEVKVRYSNPVAFFWNPDVPDGTSLNVAQEVTVRQALADRHIDSDAANAPLYSKLTGQVHFLNCVDPGNGSVSTNDTPTSGEHRRNIEIEIGVGEPGAIVSMGSAIYSSREELSIDYSFTCWTVVYDILTSEVQPIAQRSWGIEATSALAGPQAAAYGVLVTSPTVQPVVSGQSANDALNSDASKSYQFGGPNITFTSPDLNPQP